MRGSLKDRRTFLGRLGALLAVGVAPSALGAATTGAPSPRFAFGGSMAPDERWLLAASQREQRLYIDTGAPSDMAFRRAMNFYNAYNNDYGVPDGRLGVVVGMHGDSIAFALSDELWARHKLGERLAIKDANGAFVTSNPLRGSVPFGFTALGARGAHFLACNNSLRRLAGQLVPAAEAAAVHASLVAGVTAPVLVVPAMLVAASRAQQAGMPYQA